jgi:hypothetical protein
MAFYVVDRFEGKTAVIVGDDGDSFDVPRANLPKGCREGTVLRIETTGPAPNWAQAVVDDKEKMRRLDQAKRTLKQMRDSDPGGDVEL